MILLLFLFLSNGLDVRVALRLLDLLLLLNLTRRLLLRRGLLALGKVALFEVGSRYVHGRRTRHDGNRLKR